MKLNRHPLPKSSRHEISTPALIERSIASADLSELQDVEARLLSAVKMGLLPEHGQTRAALVKVRKAIAKQKLNQLFDSPEVSLTPAVLQHFPLS